MNLKKILLIILAMIIILVGGFFIFNTQDNKIQDNNKLEVVTSNFASYDFLRAIIGENENVELTFLLGPGKDSHSYEPTAGDLIKIQNADLFVYVGGESEQWAEKVIDSLNTENKKIICISDYVEKQKEEEIDGVEEKEEENGSFEDHIWTSPSNAIKMVENLQYAMEEIDEKNSEIYKQNAQSYISKIEEVDNQIQQIVNNKVRDTLIFADRMPMQYFINYYNLKVSAAFTGCSTETEASAKTIAYLEEKVKKEKIPVILYIELNNGTVAKTMAKDIGNGTEAMQIQTLHNVSLDDFNNGQTWVSLMTRNIDVLKKALQ